MDSAERKRELGRFLRDRRSRLQPADVGLAAIGRRRVAGLRREEVAVLAGVGVSWYTMLENGTATGVSPGTLAALGVALRFSEDDLAYAARLAEDRPGATPRMSIDDLTSRALAAIVWAPAYVCTSQWMVLAWNRAMSLVWNISEPGGAPFNIVERMFRDPAMRAMHGDGFPVFARSLAAMVRAGTASRLEDEEFRKMSDDLRRDPLFAEAWNNYDVIHPTGSITTHVQSIAVGSFSYRTLTLELPSDDGHWMVLQLPDAPSDARLKRALEDTAGNTLAH